MDRGKNPSLLSSISIGDPKAKFGGATSTGSAYVHHRGDHRATSFRQRPDVTECHDPKAWVLAKNQVDPALGDAYRAVRQESIDRGKGKPPVAESDWGIGSHYHVDECMTEHTNAFARPDRDWLEKAHVAGVTQHVAPLNPISGDPLGRPCPPFEHPLYGKPRASLNVAARREQRLPPLQPT